MFWKLKEKDGAALHRVYDTDIDRGTSPFDYHPIGCCSLAKIA